MSISFSLFCCTAVRFAQSSSSFSPDFSGFYVPNTNIASEDYAGAWLVSKSRLLYSIPHITEAGNNDDVTFHSTRYSDMCRVIYKKYIIIYTSISLIFTSIYFFHYFENKACATLLTRDYFDFFVEHLSAATNTLPSENDAIFAAISKKIRRKVTTMKSFGMYSARDDRMNRTLAHIVYSSNPGSADPNHFQLNIRKSFFEATFWSIYRYFPHMVVYVETPEDEILLRKSGLPILSIERIETHEKDGRAPLLLKDSILSTADKLRDAKSSKWAAFDYVFYTEADHILQMRHVSDLFHMIDGSLGNYLVVPHRMQVAIKTYFLLLFFLWFI